MLDPMPPSVSASVGQAAAMTVRPGGRIVLMGGVGMEGGESFALPDPWLMRNGITVRGQWMYQRTAPHGWCPPRRPGCSTWAVRDHGFPLSAVEEAIAYAASRAGALRMTVVHP